MDAIDILGELLGHKKSQPSRGSDVLKDIFRRGSGQSASTSSPKSQGQISREAQELEDLLNVAESRSSTRRTGSTQTSVPQQTRPLPQQTSTDRRDSSVGRNRDQDNERALVLIRAMINAAKADGKIDEAEQKKILEKMGNSSRENIDFLRNEFAKPLDVQEFIQSVPLGMEQQAYTMSLIAIELDEGSEAGYLMQLANGLRIPAEVREQIHGRLGVPSIY